MTSARDQLAAIRTFPQLVRYLRDELDWPISSNDFEELVFDYAAEDLGIDAHNAAKIQEIKRLRPLSTRQPWGIFFVRFEPKRLPVVALRRLLSGVALKKRASASSADHAAWSVSDLLFISTFGEGDARQISFAHFSHDPSKTNLPTLRILGWDNLDTPLHLDAVAEKLTANLTWPDDEDNVEAWRSRWEGAFSLRYREVVTTSRDMALRLARLAKAIRDRTITALEIETSRGPLTQLLKAFQTSLLHDLDKRGFADMYAQTIAYGLLAARIADPQGKASEELATHTGTNPFLRDLMRSFLHAGGQPGSANAPGVDFDELGISDVVELLDNSDLEAVLRDFGDRKPDEDPVIHFYELFLKEYDERQRMQRGIFYTPRPVVSFIVRSVDNLLRSEFGLEDGLADTTTWGEMAHRHPAVEIPKDVSPDRDFVQLLDPATGTGTFLVEAIEVIHETLVGKWRAAGESPAKVHELWNEYVPKHLLPRLHGFELLMAPYAIAHLKVGLKLYETGYNFADDARARIYLTNALEPAQDFSGRLEFAIPALAHEALAVNEVKSTQRFTVMIGNPPYANFGQLNRSPHILQLIEDYKRGLGERKLNLDDDYIKFLRLAEHLLSLAGVGVVGMITNSSYLDGLIHRGVRRHILDQTSRVSVLDLHGNSRRREVSPSGVDENVFDIQQGVAVTLWLRDGHPGPAKVLHSDCWGTRGAKYEYLLHASYPHVPWAELSVKPPQHLFVPRDAAPPEYGGFWSLTDIFRIFSSGMTAERDRVAIQFTRSELEDVLADFRSGDVEWLRNKYGLDSDSRDWSVAGAIADVQVHEADEALISKVLYRPFDYRYTWYSGRSRGFVGTPVPITGTHLSGGGNLALLAPRQTKEHVGAFVSASLAGHKSFSAYDRTSVFPLMLHERHSSAPQSLWDRSGSSNLRSEFVDALGAVLAPDDAELSPKSIFGYVYAILSSPMYRTRYWDQLRTDFPRIPVPREAALLRDLAALGEQLIELHLLEANRLGERPVKYTGPPNPVVRGVRWKEKDETVSIGIDDASNESSGGTPRFAGISRGTWEYRVGGFQPCEKWLKDRRGRTLSAEDIDHYERVAAAIAETITVAGQLDASVERFGGWPDAFLVEQVESIDAQSSPGASSLS